MMRLVLCVVVHALIGISYSFARVFTGAERLVAARGDILAGHRVGIISNPTGVLFDLTHIVDALWHISLEDRTFQVAAVFGPEHGFRGDNQAGKGDKGFIDPFTGLPVLSLYGKSLEDISGYFRTFNLTAVVFDIQDIGTRFYTYLWTMSDAMSAAANCSIHFVILDRPNPLSGRTDGPTLELPFASGVGRFPIPLRHGLTIGEAASFFNEQFLIVPCQLSIIAMDGYYKDMFFPETGLPFVMPSPNIPTWDTAFAYNGFGLLEGTNCSEGRGTTLPFQLVGKAGFDGNLSIAMVDMTRNGQLKGVLFREAYFVPTFSKFEGSTVSGIESIFVDPRAASPFETAVSFIVKSKQLYGEGGCQFTAYFDYLAGTAKLRQEILSGENPSQIVERYRDSLRTFERKVSEYSLYPSKMDSFH